MAGTLFTVESRFDPSGANQFIRSTNSMSSVWGTFVRGFVAGGKLLAAASAKQLALFIVTSKAVSKFLDLGRQQVTTTRAMALATGLANDEVLSLRHSLDLAAGDSGTLTKALNGNAVALDSVISRNATLRDGLRRAGITIAGLQAMSVQGRAEALSAASGQAESSALSQGVIDAIQAEQPYAPEAREALETISADAQASGKGAWGWIKQNVLGGRAVNDIGKFVGEAYNEFLQPIVHDVSGLGPAPRQQGVEGFAARLNASDTSFGRGATYARNRRRATALAALEGTGLEAGDELGGVDSYRLGRHLGGTDVSAQQIGVVVNIDPEAYNRGLRVAMQDASLNDEITWGR